MFLIYEIFLMHYAYIFIVPLISAISVSHYNLLLRRNVLFTYCVKTDSLQILKTLFIVFHHVMKVKSVKQSY